MSFLTNALMKIKANTTQILLLLLMASISVGLFMHNKAAIDAKNLHIESLQDDNGKKDLAIAELKGELSRAGESAETTKDIIDELKLENKTAKAEQVAVTAEIKRQMDAINEKYEKLPANAVNTERKNSEIAVVRASGLWAAYCLQEPTHAYCKKSK